MTLRTQGLLALALLGGCGDNVVGALPEGYVDGASTALDYPKGPYGVEVGEVFADLALEGYLREAVGTATVGYGPVKLSDLRKVAGARYLLFSVGAEWCGACRTEARELAAAAEGWAEQGGLVLGVIIQDAAGKATGQAEIDNWAERYGTNYSLAADPQARVGQRFAIDTLPLNLILDLKTMKVLKKSVGDNPQLLEAFGEQLK